jgi:hypothetical protein
VQSVIVESDLGKVRNWCTDHGQRRSGRLIKAIYLEAVERFASKRLIYHVHVSVNNQP